MGSASDIPSGMLVALSRLICLIAGYFELNLRLFYNVLLDDLWTPLTVVMQTVTG
jgi:hypothetical protein